MLSYTLRPHITALTMLVKLSSVRIMSEASLATSVPAMPCNNTLYVPLILKKTKIQFKITDYINHVNSFSFTLLLLFVINFYTFNENKTLCTGQLIFVIFNYIFNPLKHCKHYNEKYTNSSIC